VPPLAIAALAGLTFGFRLTGPLLRGRVNLPAAADRVFATATSVLLIALVMTSTWYAGHGFAGWARPAGVLAAGVLALRRAPFPVVVVTAAAVTALLRLAGVG
jgi:hypothetical protein